MIVIGTRGSDLALTQSRWVAAQLKARGVESRLEIIRTKGDETTHLSFDKIEGKGFFTKEIEDALLAKTVDLAVHSLKDLPTENPPGLLVAAIPQREDPRDCLLVRRNAYVSENPVLPLQTGAQVGTSAVRRRAQLKALRPDLVVNDLRGNVPTRVRRLQEGRYDAIILAQAGLQRLGLDLTAFACLPLPPTQFVPAPGQGALALQVRADDAATRAVVEPLHDASIAECVLAERHLLERLEGGCHVPLGAHAFCDVSGIHFLAFWGESPESARRLKLTGDDAMALAEQAYKELKAR